MNCGISMCTFKDDVPYLLYLPFDFDSYSLEKSWKDSMVFYNNMVDEGWDISINSSGYRGFHCLVSVVPKPYSRNQILSAQSFYKRYLGLTTCDSNIFGDIRRIIKIPGTCHCGKFKKDKSNHWKRIGEGSYCYTIKYNKGEVLDLDEYWPDEFPEYNYNKSNNSNNKPKHPFPCIDKCLEEYIDEYGLHEPPHLIRYSFVAYWLKMGYEPEEIYQMLYEKYSIGKKYEWADWGDTKTMNQIQQIGGNNGYNPMTCNTLRKMGFCIKECKYNHDDWFDKEK